MADDMREARTTERLELFSDGVFAIAITLLVIEIRVPEGIDPRSGALALARALGTLWPSGLAFLLSFLVIATIWYDHHESFALRPPFSVGLVVRDFALLGLVAFLPFPTAVLGQYGNANVTAIAFYAVMSSITASMSLLLARYIATTAGRSSRHVRLMVPRTAATVAIFLCTVPFAVVAPRATEMSWILIPVAQWLVVRRGGRTPDGGGSVRA